MNQTSPMNTAAAAGAAAIVTPVVAYVASLFRLTLPADVLSSIVVLLVAGAHWIGQIAAARYGSQTPATPAAPVPAGQGGFIAGLPYLAVLVPIALAAALCLQGCAGPANMWYAANLQKVESDVRGTDENITKSVVDVFCHMPRDVFLRHPELQAPADLMCGQLASGAKIDPAQLSALFGSLQRAGLVVQPGAVMPPASGAK